MTKFTDVEFLTAKEKKSILKNWIDFLKFCASGNWQKFNTDNSGSDYGLKAPKQFTKRLYEHLHLHCGYIAHYNLHGFYSEYFNGDEVDLKRFFDHFESWGDYADIGQAMIKEYEKIKDEIFTKIQENTGDKFELLKECVKRSETDLDFRKTILNKLFN